MAKQALCSEHTVMTLATSPRYVIMGHQLGYASWISKKKNMLDHPAVEHKINNDCIIHLDGTISGWVWWERLRPFVSPKKTRKKRLNPRHDLAGPLCISTKTPKTRFLLLAKTTPTLSHLHVVMPYSSLWPNRIQAIQKPRVKQNAVVRACCSGWCIFIIAIHGISGPRTCIRYVFLALLQPRIRSRRSIPVMYHNQTIPFFVQ